jgi:hypothetical protein
MGEEARKLEAENAAQVGQPQVEYEGEDFHLARHRIHAEYMLPQLIRRSLILQLWGVFEYGVCASILILERLEFRPKWDFLKKAREHFRQRSYELVPDRLVRPVSELERLRHAFMHGGGSKETVGKRRWESLEGDARMSGGFTTDRNFVFIEPPLFERLREPAYSVLFDLVDYTRQEIREGRATV